MTQPVIFISYSRRDEAEKDKLLSHLGVLQQDGLVDVWSDDRIKTGANWQTEIEQAISQAKIAVLLITANFLNSKFILSTEVKMLLHRHKHEGLEIFPVIARSCAWRAANWLQPLKVRPSKGAVWGQGGLHVDEYLTEIAEEVSKLVYQKSNGDKTFYPGFRASPTFLSMEAEESLRAGYPKDMQAITFSSDFEISQSLSNNKPIVLTLEKPLRSWQFLVVDDESNWQRRLSRMLKDIDEFDCTVVTAGGYEQAENLLDDLNFDLITVDLNLDKSTQYSDGLELVLRIREVFGQHIPIIVVTGTGNLEEQRRAFRDYGVADFIQKAKLTSEEFQKVVIKTLAEEGKC